MAAKCTVKFVASKYGPSMLLYSSNGNVINSINWSKNDRPTKKERAAASRRLMKSCAEFSRRR